MFTNNYIGLRTADFMGTAYKVTMYGGGTMSLSLGKDIGYIMRFGRCGTPTYTSDGSISDNYCGVYFGSGATPASKADTQLESLISSGLSITNPYAVVTENLGNGKHTVSATYTVKNTTDAEINIWEIGAVMENVSLYSGYDYYVYPYLVERTVLEAPITIPAGQAKVVTYKVTFNHTS